MSHQLATPFLNSPVSRQNFATLLEHSLDMTPLSRAIFESAYLACQTGFLQKFHHFSRAIFYSGFLAS